MPWITAGMVHDGKPGSYASLTLKAYNGRLFVAFLLVCISELGKQLLHRDAEVEMAILATRTLVRWFHAQETAPRFLTRETLGCYSKVSRINQLRNS